MNGDDLDRLGDDLLGAPRGAAKAARQVVSRGALNVKRGWAENARASAGQHAPLYPQSIRYELLDDKLAAEIGPDKSKPQGALGNLIEYGSANNPPHNDGGRALDAEAPVMEKYLADLAERIL